MPISPFVPIPIRGLLVPGNVDLSNRPRVKNPDGSISTVRSISIGVDGKEVLIPTITPDGKSLTNAQAIQRFQQTGEHLGVFDSPDSATNYAQMLHRSQAMTLGDYHQANR